jgi:Cytochrome P450
VELRRFAHVQAALLHPQLVVPGTQSAGHEAHTDVHAAVRAHIPLDIVRGARERLGAEALTLVDAVDVEGTCFMTTVAQPWARLVTGALTGYSDCVIDECWPLAHTIFNAAAHSPNGDTTPEAQQAAVALLGALGVQHGAAAVQTFVALSQSLPALLGCAVQALMEHPTQYAWLRAHAHTPHTNAAHELLRYATPTLAVYRHALVEVEIGEHHIRPNDLVVVQLHAANRDATHFNDPHTLQLSLGRAGHVAFGAGAHYCSGAAIVRLLLECVLEALATSRTVLSPAGPEEWLDGVALRSPVRLPVRPQ